MDTQTTHNGLSNRVAARLRRHTSPAIGFRMTAMIDIVFLLLTFFVLTAKFQKKREVINVALPRPQISETAAKQAGPMIIRLKTDPKGCQVVIETAGQTNLTQTDLQIGLSKITQNFQIAAKSHDIQTYGLELYCQDEVQWDYLVKVYDLLFRLGANKITFVYNE